MLTCRIEPWLRTWLPDEAADGLHEHFDIIPKVKSFEGFFFSPRLNFFVGVSGSGRTRLLERMKITSGLPNLPVLPSMAIESLSLGEIVFAVGLRLLESMPTSAALLCDDLCHMLDDGHLGELLQKMAKSGNQAIITVTPGELERVERLMREMGVSEYEVNWLA